MPYFSPFGSSGLRPFGRASISRNSQPMSLRSSSPKALAAGEADFAGAGAFFGGLRLREGRAFGEVALSSGETTCGIALDCVSPRFGTSAMMHQPFK